MMVEMNGDLKWKADEAIDEAYRRGYEDGKKAELAELKTIKIKMPNDDGVGMIEKIKDLIRECDKINAYTFSYPAWRLMNKLKKIVGWQLEDYEERQNELTCDDCEQDCDDRDGLCVEFKRKRQTEEIKVGDEVKYIYDEPYTRGVVTYIDGIYVFVMWKDGSLSGAYDKCCFKKTGRHFPQIAEALEQMRKERE